MIWRKLQRGCLARCYKWATIQAYYALYHGMRALLYASGLREESHVALRVAIQEMYVETGRLSEFSYDRLAHFYV